MSRVITFSRVFPSYHPIIPSAPVTAGKVGDKFSPRVWSGKPYRSKMITIAPDIEVKQIWDFERDEDGCLWIYSGTDNRIFMNRYDEAIETGSLHDTVSL